MLRTTGLTHKVKPKPWKCRSKYSEAEVTVTNDCWCCPYEADAPACFTRCKCLPTRSREFSCSLSKTGRQRFPPDTAGQQNPGAKAKRQAVHKQSHTCYSNAGSGGEKVRAVSFKEPGVVSHDPPESVCVRCAQTNTGPGPAAVEITGWNKGKRRKGRGAGNKVI